MAEVSSRESSGETKSSRGQRFRWLSWEKLAIWGLFLLVVYTLRDFFFIIFMTFIISYIMRGLVVKTRSLFFQNREVPWLERSLTIIFFALALLGSYGVGSYLGPTLRAQTYALFGRVLLVEFANGVSEDRDFLVFHEFGLGYVDYWHLICLSNSACASRRKQRHLRAHLRS